MTVETDVQAVTLDQLRAGESGTVVELHSEGAERRRMLDLGILPGTRIEVEMKSPLGDPTAYVVRGSAVALRREQARLIKVRTGEGVGDHRQGGASGGGSANSFAPTSVRPNEGEHRK